MQNNNKEQELQDAVKLWKELGITSCTMNFSCGGDSMNDYDFTFYGKEGEVPSQELNDYFDNEVFNEVEFYVNSDGHYQGESGQVEIELEEMEGEKPYFTYTKSSESEWNETFDEVGVMPLPAKFHELLNEKIHSIVGGNDGESVNYKTDCILTDEDLSLLEELNLLIYNFAEGFSFEAEGEETDWWRYTTNLEEVDTEQYEKIDGQYLDSEGNLHIFIEKTFVVYKQED